MTILKDKVAAVTGAASGIGRALAVRLVERGARVALADVNEAGLKETASLLAVPAGNATTHAIDVRSREAMKHFAADVERLHGGTDVVINNAGLAVRASLEEVSYEDFELVIDVNMWGVIFGTKEFLPYLRKRPEGHIVNISSINAMVPFAKNGPYNMSKYAVLALCETLVMELAGSPIRVTCVHPGGIRTNIARNAKGVSASDAAMFARIARTTPEQAAETILRGIERNKEQVFVGMDAKALAAAKRIVPHWIVHRTGKVMKSLEDRGKARAARKG